MPSPLPKHPQNKMVVAKIKHTLAYLSMTLPPQRAIVVVVGWLGFNGTFGTEKDTVVHTLITAHII